MLIRGKRKARERYVGAKGDPVMLRNAFRHLKALKYHRQTVIFCHVEDGKVFWGNTSRGKSLCFSALWSFADGSGTVRSDQPGMRNGLLMGEIGVEVGYHGYTGNDALPGNVYVYSILCSSSSPAAPAAAAAGTLPTPRDAFPLFFF
ncbi:hypothetical protein M0804_014849 [Polistes exclamans]|nr:hypothetical protein M0804_014851 [Polistes exclamans]KAI4474461.1 hypothetical protein M0804_014849 [Polistes exclamans]